MVGGYLLKNGIIIMQRDLTQLDIFVKKFIDVLKNHSDYLIVSGFVSISTGRVRGTEDIDVLVPIMAEEKFKSLFNDLEKNNFWCYQGDKPSTAYKYIKEFTNIRFAEQGEIFPNAEFVPIDQTKKAKWFEFTHPQKIRVKNFEFNIPPIEFEILYKERVLKGKKDMEDARHLRTFFSDMLKSDKFKEYNAIITGGLR